MKERKELFCGTDGECLRWVREQFTQAEWDALKQDKYDILPNKVGPAFSVFYKRKIKDKTIKAPLSRETRQLFKVQGVSKDHNRPLVVTLEPGDAISFRPKGTQQAVMVPIASLYHFARFTAAKAIANAKRVARKVRKGAK
jgi:hypothetical protein